MKIEFTSEDLEAFRAIVREEIEKSKAPKDEWLSRDELCKKLGMDKSTYHSHIRQGKLVVKKMGRKVAVLNAN